MQRELRHFLDWVAFFKQPARGLVPQIVKVQVVDPQELHAPGERGADRLRFERKYARVFAAVFEDHLRLAIDDGLGVGWHPEGAVVAQLSPGVLGVAQQGCALLLREIRPMEARDLFLSPAPQQWVDGTISTICVWQGRCLRTNALGSVTLSGQRPAAA